MFTKIYAILYVQIPSFLRSEFGLKSNPSLKGKKVTITGKLSEYFTHPGLKDVSAVVSVGDRTGVGSYHDYENQGLR
ncbi:DUF6359 domain-containing protein [Peribacillus butanolivorans]|uniref:DUF6359 domain-containing protein n=1 Tax=Peribacillus butanolivorans TaxID=421767 RepID=UPI00367A7652